MVRVLCMHDKEGVEEITDYSVYVWSRVNHRLQCLLLAHPGVNHRLQCLLLAHPGVNNRLQCLLLAHPGVNHRLQCLLLAHPGVVDWLLYILRQRQFQRNSVRVGYVKNPSTRETI